MKLAILLIFSIFLTNSISQQIEERSKLPLKGSNHNPYGFEEYEKKNYELTNDTKISSDMNLSKNELFKENPQVPFEVDMRQNIMLERKKIEGHYVEENKNVVKDSEKKSVRGINLLKELNDKGISSAVSESIYIAWVKHYGTGLASNHNSATDIAIDNAGNVYVTGRSTGSDTTYDYATIKYNSNGVEQWVKRYNGPGNDNDVAIAITVDGFGNVYVTGYSKGSDTYYDYATIKYNTNGVEQWIKRYNGPGNYWDEATAIAVDGTGNVYVTGFSDGIGTSADYATIKYNSNGALQWVQTYNGPGNSYDYAKAICVDVSGNVYVTGESFASNTYYDYATIKYNANGVEQWVQRYNGTASYDDRAKAISIDVSGNVYVTGISFGPGTSYDYATIKYNANGIEQWIQRYNGPGNSGDEATAIAVDGSSNVYVTGYSFGSGTNYDYTTIKYNTYGVEQWVRRYNGPGNSSDAAKAISVDGSGNVYITGISYGSGTPPDYATIKYNASGVEQWVQRYNGPGNDYDGATAIAVDGSGNVYVTGYSYGSVWSVYTTIKYTQHTVGIKDENSGLPLKFDLFQNYPNPFNPRTKIRFALPERQNINLSIYNLLGEKVDELINDEMDAGYHEVQWDASKFTSGIYLYTLQAGEFSKTKKLIFMK